MFRVQRTPPAGGDQNGAHTLLGCLEPVQQPDSYSIFVTIANRELTKQLTKKKQVKANNQEQEQNHIIKGA